MALFQDLLKNVKNFFSPPPAVKISPSATKAIQNLPKNIVIPNRTGPIAPDFGPSPIKSSSGQIDPFAASTFNGGRISVPGVRTTGSTGGSNGGASNASFSPQFSINPNPDKPALSSDRTQLSQKTPLSSFSNLLKEILGINGTGRGLTTAGNAIDAIGKTLGNPTPELNISENLQKFGNALTGTRQAYADTSYGKQSTKDKGVLGASTVNSTPTSFKNVVEYNKWLDAQRGVDKTSKANIDNAQSYITGAVGGNQDSNFTDTSGNPDDVYGIYDEKYKQIADMYDRDEISYEDAQKKQADLEREETQMLYDNLIKQQKDLIPQYEDQFNTENTRLTNYLNDAKAEGATQKTKVGNSYGELIKGARANTNAGISNLKNIFSSLGTADSSAFINKVSDAERLGGEEQTKLGQESTDKQLVIDNELTKLDRDIQDKVTALVKDKNAKIAAVNNQVNMSDGEKALKLKEITVNLNDAIRTIESDTRSKKAELIAAQQSVIDSRNNILLQGNVDSSLLDRQYALETKLGGLAGNPNVENDLNELAKPYSSMIKNNSRVKLKSQYPQLSDLIDGVADGRRSVEELRKALQSLG